MGKCGSRTAGSSPNKNFQKIPQNYILHNNSLKKAPKNDMAISTPSINNFDKMKFLENYRLENESIGEGTYGEVRRAYHYPSESYRAVKIIYKSRLPKNQIDKMQKEVTIMMRLDHPHVVKIFESFDDERIFYIVMELAHGGELFHKIQEQKRFSEKEAAEITYQIFSAINYLHKNKIIHRDIKPENIVFDDKSIKLTDFGTSLEFKGENVKQVEGTPYYIAPEVLEGSYNEKCDVWSAGVILYILLSGTPPFNGSTDNEIFEEVLKASPSYDSAAINRCSSQAKDLIKKIFVRDPRVRPSAEEVLNHEWFRVFNFRSNELNVLVLENLKKFNFTNQFEKSVYMFLANTIISKKEKEEVTQTFKKLDKNNDGVITRDELIEGYNHSNLAITPMDVEVLIKNLDDNGSGSINYSEFIAAAWNRKMEITEKKIRECFEALDLNGDGKISLDEIMKILRNNQSNLTKDWLVMIKNYDTNEDKVIDFNEFKHILENISR